MSASDAELLRDYVETGSEPAFAALVARHLDLVYSAARRQVPSAHLAEEIAQSVFVDLARNAASIRPGTPLIAWLHVVSRRTAIDVVRREVRRQAREQEAVAIAAMKSPSPDWNGIEPLLDEAVESLAPVDRAAILLRYFENKSLRDVGAALGLSEDTAQKRVSRAVEQLRGFFFRRGIAVTAAGLATDLSAHALHVAPAGLGAAITTATSTALVSTVAGGAPTLIMTTLQKTALAGALVLTAGVGLFEARALQRSSVELEQLQRESVRLSAAIGRSRAAATEAAHRLAATENEIDARLAARPAAGSAPNIAADAELERQIKAWLDAAGRLKNFLAAHPELATPELRVLSDDQWAEVVSQAAAESSLDTESGLRRAAALARIRAQNAVAPQLRSALTAYLRGSDDVLPRSLEDLRHYLTPPLTPELLARYELLHSGKSGDLPERERSTRLIGTRDVIDPERDTIMTVGLQGWATSSGKIPPARRRVQTAKP